MRIVREWDVEFVTDFLYPVFAEDSKSRIICGSDRRARKRLAHGDDRDVVRITSGVCRGLCHPFPDCGGPICDRGICGPVRHLTIPPSFVNMMIDAWRPAPGPCPR